MRIRCYANNEYTLNYTLHFYSKRWEDWVCLVQAVCNILRIRHVPNEAFLLEYVICSQKHRLLDWYAMSLLPLCVSLYTLSISPSANKSQQKVSPTLSCALRLLVTSNILLPKHRNVQLRSGSQRTITLSPTCNSLDKHALLKNISLCDAIVCPPFTEIPPGCKNLQNRQIPRN